MEKISIKQILKAKKILEKQEEKDTVKYACGCSLRRFIGPGLFTDFCKKHKRILGEWKSPS